MANISRNDQFLNQLDQTFNRADQLRVEGLQRAAQLQDLKTQALTREAGLLEKKLGKDDPRVQTMRNRVLFNQQRSPVWQEEISKAQVKVETPDPATWVVAGRVVGQNRQGLAGLTVRLYNEAGDWVQAFGQILTDAQGYFSLRIKTGPKTEVAANTAETGVSVTGTAAPKVFFLGVTDPKQKQVYLDSQPLAASPGRMAYREISLAPEDAGAPSGPVTPVEPQTNKLWVVRGSVTDAGGKPAANAQLQAADENDQPVTKPGAWQTDAKGKFEITLRLEDYPDLAKRQAELHVHVLDASGKPLASSAQKLPFVAGVTEGVNIRLRKAENRKAKGDR